MHLLWNGYSLTLFFILLVHHGGNKPLIPNPWKADTVFVLNFEFRLAVLGVLDRFN
jgi:hypothetical protein